MLWDMILKIKSDIKYKSNRIWDYSSMSKSKNSRDIVVTWDVCKKSLPFSSIDLKTKILLLNFVLPNI